MTTGIPSGRSTASPSARPRMTRTFRTSCQTTRGGAIIAWDDRRNGNWDIYVQRIDADGNSLWASNGVAACVDEADQTGPRIASNMTGGAYITWTDYRGYGTPGTSDVYAQDIDSNGYGHWFFYPDGMWIAGSGQYTEARPQIVSDGAGGAIIAWFQDMPGAAGARAQRISEGAQFLWGHGGGVPLCNADIDYEGLSIVPDGEGGVFAAWMDYRNGGTDVYVQRADADGNIYWRSNGTNICSAPGRSRTSGWPRTNPEEWSSHGPITVPGTTNAPAPSG